MKDAVIFQARVVFDDGEWIALGWPGDDIAIEGPDYEAVVREASACAEENPHSGKLVIAEINIKYHPVS